MSSLPLEILRLIFSSLATKDLLQCQLTNKQWYEGSVHKLYGRAVIRTSEKAVQYMRTIVSSSSLGSYLKFLSLTEYAEARQSMVSIVAQHCPNLLTISGLNLGFSFWFQLQKCISGGQLSKLEDIPSSVSENLEGYICTALELKSTLKYLSIQDEECEYGIDMFRSSSFSKLLLQLNEFKNLQRIDFCFASDKGLKSLDQVIDQCPRLKDITLDLAPIFSSTRYNIKLEKILPRPDIPALECNWRAIDDESQIEYLIQKFTNLQTLTIGGILAVSFMEHIYTAFRHPCHFDAVVKFLRFSMKIPDHSLEIEINRNDLFKVWKELVQLNDINNRDIVIRYADDERYKGLVGLNVYSKLHPLWITFSLDHTEVLLPHAQFFLKAGSQIRSLSIGDITDGTQFIDESSPHYSALLGLDHVIEILMECPSLQELTFDRKEYEIATTTLGFEHTQVKKLIFSQIRDEKETIPILKHLSSFLPNVKRLQLDGCFYKPGIDWPITVNIPNAFLDTLVSTGLPFHFRNNNEFQVFIRLETREGVRCYIGKTTGLSIIREARYKYYRTQPGFFFEITCQNLNELIFYSKHSKNDELKWTF